jgi:uncharacterized glyoxalase superfamily protein PhnB
VTAVALIPSLGVSDLGRSLDFYQRFFDFQVADSYEEQGLKQWCWLRAGNAQLMLQQLTADQQIRLDPAIGQSWMMYIRVDDIDAVRSELARAGFAPGEITETAYTTREFLVADPDGYDLWISVPAEQADDL